jgi:hypothetical protein
MAGGTGYDGPAALTKSSSERCVGKAGSRVLVLCNVEYQVMASCFDQARERRE